MLGSSNPIVNFPLFVYGMIRGLLEKALTDVEVFLLFLFAILLGCLTTPLMGITVGVGLYLLLRIVTQVAGLFANKLELIASVMNNHD